jgi:hypothetical protein
LKGPAEHLKSMFAADRMFFTTIYLGSMFVTLYLTCKSPICLGIDFLFDSG